MSFRIVWDRMDDDSWVGERVLMVISQREERKGRRRFYRESEGGTEWGPIAGEEHRQEPKHDWSSREWGVRLFGWRISVALIDEE